MLEGHSLWFWLFGSIFCTFQLEAVAWAAIRPSNMQEYAHVFPSLCSWYGKRCWLGGLKLPCLCALEGFYKMLVPHMSLASPENFVTLIFQERKPFDLAPDVPLAREHAVSRYTNHIFVAGSCIRNHPDAAFCKTSNESIDWSGNADSNSHRLVIII